METDHIIEWTIIAFAKLSSLRVEVAPDNNLDIIDEKISTFQSSIRLL